jgi:UPF0042 nucleotide-binding protein
MSGAGRSTAAKALEDEGFHVMDNLPTSLVSEAIHALSPRLNKIAIVLDIRGGSLSEMEDALTEIKAKRLDIATLFLDADNSELVQRFEGSRRPHPLQNQSGLLFAIEQEREMLANVRAQVDLIIDTTALSPHDLRRRIVTAFGNTETIKVVISLVSFGFKRGVPIDADLVFDARFLPNPHWRNDLRPFDGRNAAVNDFVMENPTSLEYLSAIEQVVNLVTEGYLRDGKRYLTVAIGCTGGKHRSVALIENLASRLIRADVETFIHHRDCDRD